MEEDQRLEYQSLIRSIIDQAEAMDEPEDDGEMLFDRVEALAVLRLRHCANLSILFTAEQVGSRQWVED